MRIVFQPEGERQVEQGLGVGSPLDLGKQRFADRQHQVAFDRREAPDEPVVHPQPAAVPERMAVRLLHRRPDRRADVREEQVRAHMAGELAQVLVIPRARHWVCGGMRAAARHHLPVPGHDRRQ
jgi:hypothetical protein